MEVILGFAVGYWIGTNQGRQGMQKALDSAQAIWASPETRRLLSEGLSAFETMAAPAMDRMNGKSNGGKTALISSVMDELIQRRQARRAA